MLQSRTALVWTVAATTLAACLGATPRPGVDAALTGTGGSLAPPPSGGATAPSGGSGGEAGRPADAAPPADGPAAIDVSGPDDAPGAAFENSLGMPFVPVPGTSVMFSIWETRVMDYQAFGQATGAAIPRTDFPETALQPKAAVSRAQATAFAAWLTTKEQKEGKISATARYRLPTDVEWDAAIEVGKTGGDYAWGSAFPPPDNFCNYELTNDGFTYTAPVGSFAPNRLGLYDMVGNLWEWIGQGCTSGGAYLVRGAGWNAHTASFMALTFHYCFPGDLVGHHNVGFRVVLEGF